mgnify:CR=1 FL=1
MQQDEDFMREALLLAANARGRTSPNPLVGAVIVREGRIVGAGWHRKAGTPHAEVHALAMAGDLAHGATAYVTLEPCSHHGRTGPCAEALVKAGVKRVVTARIKRSFCIFVTYTALLADEFDFFKFLHDCCLLGNLKTPFAFVVSHGLLIRLTDSCDLIKF